MAVGDIKISAILIRTIPGVFIDRGLRYRTSRGTWRIYRPGVFAIALPVAPGVFIDRGLRYRTSCATRSATAKTPVDKYARDRADKRHLIPPRYAGGRKRFQSDLGRGSGLGGALRLQLYLAQLDLH